MEKFFEAGTLTDEELVAGLRSATGAGKLFPLVCTSATLNIGIQPLLDAILAYLPSPADRPFKGDRQVGRRGPRRRPTRRRRPSAFVWKTIADPFAGRITMFRVVSGIAEVGFDGPQQDEGRARAARPPRAAAGQDADAGAGDQGRRSRRGRQAEGHADQRHARRQGRPGHLSADQVSRAGAVVRHRAEDPRRRGQDQHVDAPPRGRGPVDPLQPRSADQGTAALRARASCTSRSPSPS